MSAEISHSSQEFIVFYSSVHSPTVDRINLRDLQGDVLSLLGSGTEFPTGGPKKICCCLSLVPLHGTIEEYCGVY